MYPSKQLAAVAVAATLVFAGCSAAGHGETHGSGSGHSMAHPVDGGPAPAGIAAKSDARYPVGTSVILAADHMESMMNAKATIVGAFSTTTYAVDYTPTTGGSRVTGHKWVVAEELEGVSGPLKVGDQAVMTAEHMPGMKGAKATVAQVSSETVYMVDYDMAGMTMKNHKWVVESEIRPGK